MKAVPQSRSEAPKSVDREEGEAAKMTLAAVVSHPLRTKCWVILAERPASPNELSRLFEQPLARVAYHVRELKKAGVIELCKTEPRRGSTEHWYRATERPLLDDEETLVRSVEERLEYARYIFQREFAGRVVIFGVLLDAEDRKMTSKRFATAPEGARAARCALPRPADSRGVARRPPRKGPDRAQLQVQERVSGEHVARVAHTAERAPHPRQAVV